MANIAALRCKECSREYPVGAFNVCDFCFGPLEVVYDMDAIAQVASRERIKSGPLSLWRYADFLPADYNPNIDINAKNVYILIYFLFFVQYNFEYS